MDRPIGYELRAPTPDDLDAVAAVLIAGDLDDAGQVVLDADFVRDEWSREGFDLPTDAWVVVDAAGAFVGYGQAMRVPVNDDSENATGPLLRDHEFAVFNKIGPVQGEDGY